MINRRHCSRGQPQGLVWETPATRPSRSGREDGGAVPEAGPETGPESAVTLPGLLLSIGGVRLHEFYLFVVTVKTGQKMDEHARCNPRAQTMLS
jgi:hypothetical protein